MRSCPDLHRAVWIVRLSVHSVGCLMIYAGPAKHPFLVSNRKWMLASLLLFGICFLVQEGRPYYERDALLTLGSAAYKAGEACVAFVVLSGCLLVHAVLQKQDYKLTSAFYVVLALYAAALLTNNVIKLGYVANAAVSAVSFSVMRDFQRAHLGPPGNGGGGAAGGGDGQISTIQSIVRLEASLVALNAAIFVLALWNPDATYGIKAAVYVFYIFRITLVYLLVRPYLAPAGADLDHVALAVG